MAICIKGSFSKTIFQSSTGYHVGIFKVSDSDDDSMKDYINRTITFTGYFHELNTIDTYLFYGEVVHHEKYGEQFQVNSYERCKPNEKDSIIEFLSSDLFKGIGEKKAARIVDVLGADTLKIILEHPDNLILIPTITKKDVDTLHKQLLDYESSYEVIMYLTDMGFSTRDAMLIYNTYKSKTKSVLEDNIYSLIDDIMDLYFKKVDMIALRNGVEKDSFNRILAAILYIMNEVSNTFGHCYYYDTEILEYLPRVLGIDISNDIFFNALSLLIEEEKIIKKGERYYLKDMFDAECMIVKRFRLLNSVKELSSKKLDSMIHDLEAFFGIQYNEGQLDAIRKSYAKSFLVITGGPGTGKTTIMKGICELYRQMNHYSYEQLDQKVALLAPTGRAAKRMSEATMMRASTIHRFLKWQKDTNTFQVNEYNKSKVEFVILDEASMVDTYLMASLLKGLSANCKIVLVGDDHQLPSVGPGNLLHDVIDSGMLETVELKELYRQGADSHILTLAYDIRRQDVSLDIFNVDEDLTFIQCLDHDVVSQVSDICRTYMDLNYRQFQILAPMYKGINGIDEINKQVQKIFNPKDSLLLEHKIGDVLFRENDKVIQLTNMPDDNVYNGDIGLVEQIILHPKKEIHIDFDGNEVRYTPTNFNNFRLAYAISVHKAQGSEFDVVVIPIVKGYSKMLYQKLIYTAVTRAKKRLYLVGDFSALKMACKNNQEGIRRTSIKDYLISGIK